MAKRMRANDTWTLPENGRLLVTGNPGIGRYIFGVPWLLFGVHFLYKYLVLGIAEYIKAGDIAGIFTGVLGWLVVLLMGSIFVVPGWLLVFLRRRVVIDTVYGKLEEKMTTCCSAAARPTTWRISAPSFLPKPAAVVQAAGWRPTCTRSACCPARRGIMFCSASCRTRRRPGASARQWRSCFACPAPWQTRPKKAGRRQVPDLRASLSGAFRAQPRCPASMPGGCWPGA